MFRTDDQVQSDNTDEGYLIQSDDSHTLKTLRRNKLSYLLNIYQSANIFTGSFFQVAYLTFMELRGYGQGQDLINKDLQGGIQDNSKYYGVLTALVCSIIIAIAWGASYRRVKERELEAKNKQLAEEAVKQNKPIPEKIKYDENEIYKQFKNDPYSWPRRFTTWVVVGSSFGEAAVEVFFLALGFIIPAPLFQMLERAIKSPLRSGVAFIGGMVVGVFGCLFSSTETTSNKSDDLKKFYGRESWARYVKRGAPIGGPIGGAIGALIGFFSPFPGGMIAGAGLGMALGKLIGIAVFKWCVPLYNKWFKKELVTYTANDVIVCDQEPEQLEENKIYAWFANSNRNEIVYKVKKDGKKAIITLGKPKDATALHDIEQDPQTFYLNSVKAKEEIIKIASKNHDIDPQNINDDKGRSKYLGTGAILGTALGMMVGLGLGIAFPMVGIPLMFFVCSGVFTLAGAVLYSKFGPALQSKINPYDQSYNSMDYGGQAAMTTGQSLGQIISALWAKDVINALGVDLLYQDDGYTGDGVKKIIKDVLVYAIGLVAAVIGMIYDARDGCQQQKRLDKYIDDKCKDGKTTREEAVHEFAVEFRKNQPILTWSQLISQVATSFGLGGAIGGAIGFAIAGPVGGLIGLGIGCAVGIPVALLFGEKIHEKYLDLSEWLGNKIFGYKPASPSSSPKASLVNSPQDSPITRNASEGDLSQDKNNVQHEKQQEVKQEQAVKGEREEESSQAHIQQIVSPNIISPPTKLGSEKPIPNVSLEETSKIVADISKKIKLAPGEISLVRPHQTVRKNINEAQTTIDLSSPVSVPALAPSVSILIEPIRPQLIKDDFVDSGALVTSASASYPRPIAPVEPLNSSRSSDSDTDETISTIESQDAGSDLGGGSDTSSDSGSSPGPGPQPGPDAEPGNDADPGYDGGSNSGSDSNSGSNLGSGSGFGSSGNSNQCLNVVVGSAVFIAKNDLDTPNVEVEQVIRGCLDDILSTDDSNLSAENSSHLNIETHKQPANNSISSLITIIFDRQRGIKEQKKGVINICRKKPSILLDPIGNTLNLNHGANGLSPIQLACCLGNFDLVKKMLVFLDQQADEKLNDIAINQINEWMCAKRCYFTELQTQKINYHFYLLENEITRRHLTSGNYKASKYFNLVFKRAFESKGAACSGLDVYYALTRAINLYINVSNQWDDEQLSFFSDHVLGFFKSHLPDVDFSLLDNIEKIVKRRKWRNVDGEHNELANKCLTHLLRFDSLHYYSPLIKFKDWLAWWPQVRTYVNWSKEMDNQLRLAGKPLPSIQDADLIKGMGLFGPNKPSAVTQVGASVTNAMTLFGRSAPQVRNQQSVKVFRSYELS